MRTSIILLFTFFSLVTFAQDFDFGKVSKEELEEKYNPLDSSANATYLYKYRKTFIEYSEHKGFELVTEIHERIKIYNQEGFDYATAEVRLGKSGSDKEEFSSLKAYTYNFVDGKIQDDKIGKDGIFESELHKYADQVKFTMSNVKPGCVIEYKYKITSPFITNVDEFVFQHDIPVKEIVAKFESPEYFNFKLNTKGFIHVSPNNTKENGKITFVNKNRSQNGNYSPVETSYNSSDLEFTKNISSYNLSNIPALKEEPYVDNINNYRSAIKYELSYTNFPQATLKYYSTTWEDVVKTIYDSPSFGDELNKSGYYEKDIDAIISSVSDPIQRASLIFDFVKSKMKWNGYYSYYANDGVKKAYKDQVGNVAEINLMLTSMLRFAGLNANPVLVSTRQNGIPIFPTIEGYNYVISCIETPEGAILFDATNKYSAPNVLPIRTLNWEGRIIRKDKSSTTLNLYPSIKSENRTTMLITLSDNGEIQGGIRTLKTNHKAMTYRENYIESDKDGFLENRENKFSGIEISDFAVTNEFDLSKPVLESYKFLFESQADIINDKIYFSPFFFLKTTENPFKLEKREFPVDFGYPSSSSFTLTVNLPDSYKVESIPEAMVLVLPDDLGSYKYKILVKENSIQLIMNTEINQSRISPMYYEELKEYFNKFIEKENEQIVLTKI